VLIEVENLRRVYRMGANEVVALNGLDLSIEAGEFVTIMGPSGSGKSTFMHLLGCLDRATSGRYVLDGVKVHDLEDRELSGLRNRKVGFVFQSFNLIAQLNVLENVELPLIYARLPRNERRERAQQLLERVGLADRETHRPNELSGGEQQRVAISRALVNEPRLVLADEPTGNLDSSTGLDILRLFSELHEHGTTVVLVTHDPEVAHWSTRVVTMRDGEIESDAAAPSAVRGPGGTLRSFAGGSWREEG
jgi:putative ABC transport system ATP-binding protein